MTGNEETKYEQFDDLINRHCKLIRKLCWRHSSGSESQCNELVQDCYISIWCHLPSLRPDAHPLQRTAWVVLQCRSVFSHRQRQLHALHWSLCPIDEQLADILSTPDDTSRHKLMEELAADLPPNECRLLALMMEGCGQKEIAEELGVSVEAAKKMRQRLIKKIQKKNNHE